MLLLLLGLALELVFRAGTAARCLGSGVASMKRRCSKVQLARAMRRRHTARPSASTKRVALLAAENAADDDVEDDDDDDDEEEEEEEEEEEYNDEEIESDKAEAACASAASALDSPEDSAGKDAEPSDDEASTGRGHRSLAPHSRERRSRTQAS